MSELAFLGQHNNSQLKSRYAGGNGGDRDVSPESVIFSVESTFGLFPSSASASASIERCSSASDVLDHDSLVSDMSPHLSGGFSDSSSTRCSDPDPNNNFTVRNNGGQHLMSKKVENVKETDGENQTLYSARSSFSQTVEECQSRKSRSEILLRKADRRRPASMDLNNQPINVTSLSPRLGVAMKSSVSSRQSGVFPSPGTLNYHPTSIGVQKGWSSERLPLHTNASRRHVSFTLMSYNSGRALPSKWEDAERWLISPVAGDGASRPSVQQAQRRPKSKSGPLGPPGSAYYSMYSPAVPIYAGNGGRFVIGSPLPNGVDAGNGSSIQYNSGKFPSLTEPCMARSVSVQGCSELLSQSLLRITQDHKIDVFKNDCTKVSWDVSRRDMATQMSPESSLYSSPTNINSSSLSSSILPVAESQHTRSSKADIRDVQVDDRVTLTKWSKKNRAQIQGRGSDIVDHWKRKVLEVQSADWEVSEMTKSLSKMKREDAKITAWENLQKAKAEAAIRKLEMKLEKKRSSSMDKIMNKLRSAQKKAQEMRGSVLSNESHQVARSSHKTISLIKTPQIQSLSGCFTCPAF